MKKYAFNGQNAAGQTNKTLTTAKGAAAIRPYVKKNLFGLPTNPNNTDFYWEGAIAPFSADGTPGANPTPQALDSADPAAVTTAGNAYSVEPTYGADVLEIPANQRSTFMYPCEDGGEFVNTAATGKGIGAYLKNSGLGSNIQINNTMTFIE